MKLFQIQNSETRTKFSSLARDDLMLWKF